MKSRNKSNKKITELLFGTREHVVMRNYNTFRVGGVADYFYEAKTIENLIGAVKIAHKIKMPYFILGNGSNILFSDYGFAGLVIKNSTSHIAVMKEKSQVIVDSGVMLSRLITECASNDLSGLEFLYGVPGTVGGAIYGNAGAWGNAIGDYLKNITVLEFDEESGRPKVNWRDLAWLELSYRSSRFKKIKIKNKPVILTAHFQFSQSQKEEIIRRLNAAKEKRQKNQPLGLSAGSVFKNPIPKELKNITGSGTRGMPELPKERTAGYMLEQAGAKKFKVNAAEVSSVHSNFIINKNGTSASDIRILIEKMRDKVKEKYNIILEEEIEYVGQW